MNGLLVILMKYIKICTDAARIRSLCMQRAIVPHPEPFMSEFRQNLATKEWVIIAPDRTHRPTDQPQEDAPAVPDVPLRSDSSQCPFCPGNEDRTGPEVLRYTDADAWSLRVVRNKYSVLDDEHSVHRRQAGLFLASDSYGVAEVIVETPEHRAPMHTMSVDRIGLVLRAYRERARCIGAMPNISIVMIFRNYGPLAGTSLEHPHSQIIASPIIPPHVRDPFQKAALHYDSYGTCVYCDMVREEIRQEERIIEMNEHMVAFCPFASRSPYEIRVYPLRHNPGFVLCSDEELAALASILRSTLARLMRTLGETSYNFIIRAAPIGDEDVRYLHWYIVLIPKVSTPAGFEIGSGIYINASAPEDCAAHLRAASV
jgi:UDPglucose--hexose-1-phosphate uridylyltransferase